MELPSRRGGKAAGMGQGREFAGKAVPWGRTHGGARGWLLVGVVLAVSTFVAPAVITPAPASASPSCSTESTKFVQQVAGTNLYYGNRDAIYTYDDRPICTGEANAHSTFMRISDDYLSWVEVGVQQTPDGVAHFWSE